MKPHHKEYKGQNIEIREVDKKENLFINNIQMKYGQLPDGLYFLDEYAYDWKENLEDLAKAFIDYQNNVKNIRREKRLGKGDK